jgi:peptidoglycan pentaglycine glycine transferase (the first glycine)
MRTINLTKDSWNDFISSQTHSQFLESWEWGEFQESAGNKIFRLGVEANGKMAAAALLIKKSLVGGFSYIYCPRGPVTGSHNINRIAYNDLLEFLLNEIKGIAKKEKCIFLRFEPEITISEDLGNQESRVEKFNPACLPDGQACAGMAIKRTIDIQPAKTLILDLSIPETDLLGEMHQKTRYNIRLAEKKGIEIKEASPERFDEFWNLMKETKDRDGFRLHGKEHYKKLISNFQPARPASFTGRQANASPISDLPKEKFYIKIYGAFFENRMIAANIVTFFGDTVTYMHGASSNGHRNLMAPYALQWQTIKLARNMNYKYYDFYGIDEAKWPGVTRFKRGFGGEEKIYPGTFDLAFDRMAYGIYGILRKIKRII